jgi:hypothetical protein
MFPKPLISWLRGLDLNQRPLGYEGKSAGRAHQRKPTELKIVPICTMPSLGDLGSSRSVYFIVFS